MTWAPFARAAALIVAAATAIGCYGFGYQFNVRNESADEVVVRVPFGSPRPDAHFVVTVAPGADGPALAWYGSDDVSIEVLDANCAVVGRFERGADGQYTTAVAPGVVGSIAPYRWNDQWNNDAIRANYECGSTKVP